MNTITLTKTQALAILAAIIGFAIAIAIEILAWD
jgi:hypothetical protein